MLAANISNTSVMEILRFASEHPRIPELAKMCHMHIMNAGKKLSSTSNFTTNFTHDLLEDFIETVREGYLYGF